MSDELTAEEIAAFGVLPTDVRIDEARAEGRSDDALDDFLLREFWHGLQRLRGEAGAQVEAIEQQFLNAPTLNEGYHLASMAAMKVAWPTVAGFLVTSLLVMIYSLADRAATAQREDGHSDEWAEATMLAFHAGRASAMVLNDQAGVFSKAQQFDEKYGKSLAKLRKGNESREQRAKLWQGKLTAFAVPLLAQAGGLTNAQVVDRFKRQHPEVQIPASDGPARLVGRLRTGKTSLAPE